MITSYVKPHELGSIARLANEQLILCFTMSDLKDQLRLQCQERGEIISKTLALLFDMIHSYEASFDKVIQKEVTFFKEELKQ